MSFNHSIATASDLELQLSLPTAGVLETLRAIHGNFLVLGAGGKMGPTLSRMVRRGLEAIEETHRTVTAVSRFSSRMAEGSLRQQGVRTMACDLLDRKQVEALPDAPNVIFMAGQKFGTSDSPDQTWAMNTYVPALIAERYSKSRIVVFSTGCVYPLTTVDGPGSNEKDSLGPIGDYANSCVGRERIFSYFSKLYSTPMLMFRLSYAIDLRYGVLSDVAQKVAQGIPVDITMPVVNVIWQGDANARAIQCLAHTRSPATALNVTGSERVSIRWLAERFGELFRRPPTFTGQEAPTAWLFDTRRSYEWFGEPTVPLEQMIQWTAQWVQQGGETLGKPTHFEVRDGKY